jgi:hypothetical protein
MITHVGGSPRGGQPGIVGHADAGVLSTGTAGSTRAADAEDGVVGGDLLEGRYVRVVVHRDVRPGAWCPLELPLQDGSATGRIDLHEAHVFAPSGAKHGRPAGCAAIRHPGGCRARVTSRFTLNGARCLTLGVPWPVG